MLEDSLPNTVGSLRKNDALVNRFLAEFDDGNTYYTVGKYLRLRQAHQHCFPAFDCDSLPSGEDV